MKEYGIFSLGTYVDQFFLHERGFDSYTDAKDAIDSYYKSEGLLVMEVCFYHDAPKDCCEDCLYVEEEVLI